MIEIVTFTGIDESTPYDAIKRLTGKSPFCEFAILAGTMSGSHPRFPAVDTVEHWRTYAKENQIRSAIHLCGNYARNACSDNPRQAAALASGFGRVQVNLPPADRKTNATRIEAFAERIETTVILQHDGAWHTAPGGWTGRIEHLFDRSAGRGLCAIEGWPSPPKNTERRVGYAGGIDPETIDQALQFAGRFPNSQLWLDMESGVRTNDRFNVDAVEAICERIEASGLAEQRGKAGKVGVT